MTATDVSVDQEPVPAPPIPEPGIKPTPAVARERVFVGTGLLWGLVVGVLTLIAHGEDPPLDRSEMGVHVVTAFSLPDRTLQ